MDLSWLGNLTRPFSSLFNPLAERIGTWLGGRKPKLHVHPVIAQCVWCLAWQGQPNNPETEMMQVVFWADLNHDDPTQTLVITQAYPQGTVPQIGPLGNIAIPPQTMVRRQVAAFVRPVKGKKGESFVTRFVLVDQFHRKHKTQKLVFRWTGQAPATSPS